MGDHSECVQVEYDPQLITYGDLLSEFWVMHSPTSQPYSQQYASLILTSDGAQAAAAEASRDQLVATTGRSLFTVVKPLEFFFPAEDYHQKYALRNDQLLNGEFHAHYPDEVAFRESSAAALLNGYVYGAGSIESLENQIRGLGLSSQAEKHLRGLVARGAI